MRFYIYNDDGSKIGYIELYDKNTADNAAVYSVTDTAGDAPSSSDTPRNTIEDIINKINITKVLEKKELPFGSNVNDTLEHKTYIKNYVSTMNIDDLKKEFKY